MNPAIENQSEVAEIENPLKGTIKSKIENILTGKEQVMEGNYSLPQATDSVSMSELSNGNEADMVFWYNQGRKFAARAQVKALLEFDLGDDKLNSLYGTFKNALKNMVTDKTPEKRRKEVIEFILSGEQFEPLREGLKNYQPGNITVDFSTVELKKPQGKRGRPAADSSSKSEGESDTEE